MTGVQTCALPISTIISNNIFNNAEYNLQLGDFNKENINIPNNFWGEKTDYYELIHDKKDDEYIGKVEIMPVTEKEIHWNDEMTVKKLRP